ncbi:MAG: hypothetical protein IKG80_01670 [Clostridia bacterium]|nr:hypothetical protein [Clostridia bacterium]MBR6918306.1 hypothetical protein [Clostridia bacterium]
MEYIRDVIIACAVGAVASALTPPRVGRAIRALALLIVAVTAVSPIARLTSHAGDLLKDGTELSVNDAPSYDDAVLEETAATLASYVRDTLDEKYGIRSDVRISVLFDDSPDAFTLKEIQIFSGIRFDSYRDRKIEEELSESLGCDVFIFSE